jgi:hypothetical protein
MERHVLLDQRRVEHVPAGIDPGRLVESRQLRLLQRWRALLHRLQRDVLVRLRTERRVRVELPELRMPLRRRTLR